MIYFVKVRASKNKFAHIKIFRDLSNPPNYELSDAKFNKKQSDSLLGSFINICNQNKQVGPCRAAFMRYYYDKTIQKCTDFVYGMLYTVYVSVFSSETLSIEITHVYIFYKNNINVPTYNIKSELITFQFG